MPPAFLVEGKMEQIVVQRLCVNAPVRILGANGRDVSPEAIAKRAAPLIRLLKNNHPIIILFDREGRIETCSQIREQFILALKSNGVSRDDIVVGVPDRMIENWILSCGIFRSKHKLAESYEGCHGKPRLASILASANESYHETTVGVDLFCEIDVETVSVKSESFSLFRAAIEPYCSWARPRMKRAGAMGRGRAESRARKKRHT